MEVSCHFIYDFKKSRIHSGLYVGSTWNSLSKSQHSADCLILKAGMVYPFRLSRTDELNIDVETKRIYRHITERSLHGHWI